MKTTIKIGIVGLSIVLLTGCKEKSLQTEMPAPPSVLQRLSYKISR